MKYFQQEFSTHHYSWKRWVTASFWSSFLASSKVGIIGNSNFLHSTFSFQSRSSFPPLPSLSPQTDMEQHYNKHTEGRQLPTCQNEPLEYLLCCRDSAAQNGMNHVCPLKLNQIQYSLSRVIHHSRAKGAVIPYSTLATFWREHSLFVTWDGQADCTAVGTAPRQCAAALGLTYSNRSHRYLEDYLQINVKSLQHLAYVQRYCISSYKMTEVPTGNAPTQTNVQIFSS